MSAVGPPASHRPDPPVLTWVPTSDPRSKRDRILELGHNSLTTVLVRLADLRDGECDAPTDPIERNELLREASFYQLVRVDTLASPPAVPVTSALLESHLAHHASVVSIPAAPFHSSRTTLTPQPPNTPSFSGGLDQAAGWGGPD